MFLNPFSSNIFAPIKLLLPDRQYNSNFSCLLYFSYFYYENPQCHDWQKQTGVSIMNLLKIKEWTNLFKKAGFKDVKKHQFCASGEWNGTLVVEGTKI
jgi:hypothetical protein